MKLRNSHWLAVGLLLLAVLYFAFRPNRSESGMGSQDGESSGSNVRANQSGGPPSPGAEVTKRNRDPINRHEKSNNDLRAKPNDQPLVELINEDGELNEAGLESHGLSKAQIDEAREVFYEISKDISDHFIKNCKQEVIGDGSFIYVLKGDAGLALALKDKMRTRLGDVIGLDSSGTRLADQITEGVKGRALLDFGADDMIGAEFRDIPKPGAGWEDGMRINGKMPGMIDYYRENGWPDGAHIHESGGKAIFHPIKKKP
ncbi:hypothetical protein OKA05_03415 [Luteolibacter arcticus]|uniref:Uncharacterized protein n=1 Tax=Luteolibacter arcticus TaxID=1581411 RepID=A0ABT3GD83_9BACT|nr:hypothetical protein [Luteolibacter arcticus]MCW1921587.1 hypothetical protein [Luteolibacter arcticus]